MLSPLYKLFAKNTPIQLKHFNAYCRYNNYLAQSYPVEFSFDSVIFHSKNIKELRKFYEGKLGFPTGTFEKNGERYADFSDSYVNYHIGGGLVCFEYEAEAEETGIGDLVLRVSDFARFKEKVRAAAVPIVKENNFFFMIKDPEGRTLIFEPIRNA